MLLSWFKNSFFSVPPAPSSLSNNSAFLNAVEQRKKLIYQYSSIPKEIRNDARLVKKYLIRRRNVLSNVDQTKKCLEDVTVFWELLKNEQRIKWNEMIAALVFFYIVIVFMESIATRNFYESNQEESNELFPLFYPVMDVLIFLIKKMSIFYVSVNVEQFQNEYMKSQRMLVLVGLKSLKDKMNNEHKHQPNLKELRVLFNRFNTTTTLDWQNALERCSLKLKEDIERLKSLDSLYPKVQAFFQGVTDPNATHYRFFHQSGIDVSQHIFDEVIESDFISKKLKPLSAKL